MLPTLLHTNSNSPSPDKLPPRAHADALVAVAHTVDRRAVAALLASVPKAAALGAGQTTVNISFQPLVKLAVEASAIACCCCFWCEAEAARGGF